MKNKGRVFFADERFGDDSNDGRTWQTAKKTISISRLRLGDSLFIAPVYGRYYPVLNWFGRIKGWRIQLNDDEEYIAKTRDNAEIISRLVNLEVLLTLKKAMK